MSKVAIKYRILFSKKSAKISRASLEEFAHLVLRGFGGSSLLGDVSIRGGDGNTVEILTTSDSAAIVHGAFLLRGEYKSLKCCFKCIEG